MALSLKETLVVGFSDFWSRKVRSIVTIFSIILGTMSIIVVQSLVKGVQDSTLFWMMERGGLTRINIERNWQYDNPRNLPNYLTFREFTLIQRLVPEAEYSSPAMQSWGSRISYNDKSITSHVNSVLPDYPKIEEWDVAEGRFISQIDINRMNDVVVIGSTIREELFGNRRAIGEYITSQGRRLQVIGVMERKFYYTQNHWGSDNLLEYQNRFIFLPITTSINKLAMQDRIWSASFKSPDLDKTVELREKLSSIMLNLRSGEPVFEVTSAKETAENIAEGSAVFGVVFFIISMISLFVGGIVIMNIMMATVQERTREIGIRMAVGAHRYDIFMQFIIQTLIVTIAGGIIGILAGFSVLGFVSGFIGIAMSGGISMVIVSLIIVTILGLVFGIFPAIKASNLDPVKCLSSI